MPSASASFSAGCFVDSVVLEVLASLLSERRGGGTPMRQLSVRLAAPAAAVLLVIAAIGFLVAALYETFLQMSDRIAAPLLVAATLAAAAGLIVLSIWAVNARREAGAPRRRERPEKGEADIASFVTEMGAAVSNQRIAPLTAVGLALAAGLARGMRK